ncbi:TonB-dependent receptor [uncultured Prevotella sp.]|uniref:TonB-dependent receptor n=1 Tax=uncultured Prevotella sp. TaxID=159272 RepID=UPI0025EC2B21|nr:TonB-dependent receptor [uncultured Prevotella sp.]
MPMYGDNIKDNVTLPEMGTITGRITDADRQVLPGATIMIEELHTGVTSDVNGFYTLANLKPGTYKVKVSYVGYEPKYYTVKLTGNNVERNIQLSESHELKEVVVTGAFYGQRKALQMQKETMGVTNVVSADQVGKFPDSNIGDALKRINGINVQYDQGEARFGQVRGTSADLTSVTVNGNRIPSAEGDTRNVQLDLIPADMVQTIEVNKVVTSDMDGDAIGGEINLVTKNTPSHRVLNFNVGSGYTWVSGKPQLDLGATWGDRFFNHKLGIMAAASYQYAPGGSDNTEFEYEENDDKQLELKEAQVRQYYVTRERQSYSLALDYKFNPQHKISFKGMYNRRSDWENRYRISYKKLNSKAEKQSIVMQTKAGASDTKNARLELQQTMDYTFDGEHLFGNLKMDWAASYSRATEERPNERYASYKYNNKNVKIKFGEGFEDVGDRQPYYAASLPALDDTNWKLDELDNSNQDIVENEWKGRLNFTLPITNGLYGNTLKFGAKYTSKEKTRTKSFFDYDPEEVLGDSWRNLTVQQIRDGFMPGSQYPANSPFISKQTLGNIDFSKYEGTENYEEEAGNYKIREQITAGYLRFDQKLGKRLSATLGLRVERTDLKTSGYNVEVTDDESTMKPTGDFKNHYTDLLPSLLLKYKYSDDGSLRASVTKTISRPKYSALIANKTFNISDEEATIGDPNTKPAKAVNVDLSLDHYFKSVGLVSLGIFYKDIKNVNVEWSSNKYLGSDLGLTGKNAEKQFNVQQNINAYDARVLGVEVAYQRDFGFISPALKCLGFYGNYTYTHSTTRNFNERLGIKDGDDVKVAGSPEHTANASMFFEKSGINLRLSYNFASAFIDQMSTSRALDRYYDKVGYLDLNASYTWGKKTKFTVYANANNLLNQPLRYYQGEKNRTMQVEYYGVRLNAGVKINL